MDRGSAPLFLFPADRCCPRTQGAGPSYDVIVVGRGRHGQRHGRRARRAGPAGPGPGAVGRTHRDRLIGWRDTHHPARLQRGSPLRAARPARLRAVACAGCPGRRAAAHHDRRHRRRASRLGHGPGCPDRVPRARHPVRAAGGAGAACAVPGLRLARRDGRGVPGGCRLRALRAGHRRICDDRHRRRRGDPRPRAGHRLGAGWAMACVVRTERARVPGTPAGALGGRLDELAGRAAADARGPRAAGAPLDAAAAARAVPGGRLPGVHPRRRRHRVVRLPELRHPGLSSSAGITTAGRSSTPTASIGTRSTPRTNDCFGTAWRATSRMPTVRC